MNAISELAIEPIAPKRPKSKIVRAAAYVGRSIAVFFIMAIYRGFAFFARRGGIFRSRP